MSTKMKPVVAVT